MKKYIAIYRLFCVESLCLHVRHAVPHPQLPKEAMMFPNKVL